MSKSDWKFVRFMLFAVVTPTMMLISLASSCRTVDTGHVGVQKTMGMVHDEPLQPGVHFVLPFGVAAGADRTTFRPCDSEERVGRVSRPQGRRG